MIEYQQLSEFQLETLRANRTGMKFLQLIPDQEKDPVVEYSEFIRMNAETDELVRLGLMRSIPAKDDFVRDMEQRYQREFRIFEITLLGKQFVDPQTSKYAN
jgi:hypothetical protein